MTFTTRNGTRGRRPAPAWFLRIGNRIFTHRIRKGAAGVAGGNALVLVTRGRKTGDRRENPVAWFPGPEGSWIVVAAYNGAAANPGWYWNLAAAPDAAVAVVRGEEIPVHAQELHGAERAEAWAAIVAASPRFAEYETITDRVVPVIRLTRRG